MDSKGKKSPIRAEKSTDSEFVRRFKTNPFVFGGTIFVLVIVVIAFVFVPAIGPGAGQMPDYTFGYYDKVPISYVPGNYLAERYAEMSNYYRNMGDMYNNMFFEQQMWREAFELAVFRTAVLQEMKRAGYSVPAKTVDRQVALQFMENGRFSSALYNRYDNNSRLALWRRTQEDITAQRYLVEMNNLYKPEQAAQFIAKMAIPVRRFDLVSFPVNSYPDSAILSYAQQHADMFRQTHLSQITIVSSEREARQILQSITDGITTFEDAAKAHSQDMYTDRGGDMGIKAVHELLAEIPGEAEREQVIALGKGQLSGILKTDAGWAIFRAEEDVQPLDFTDAASLDRVRSYIQFYERGRMEDWAYENAISFTATANGKGFDAALRENNLEKQSFGPIPLNFGDVDLFASLSATSIPELSGASSSENFWKAAFGTAINTLSEPLVHDGNVLVLLPLSEEAADETTIENIVSSYNDYWINNISYYTMRTHFITSSRMDDRFYDTFRRELMPQN